MSMSKPSYEHGQEEPNKGFSSTSMRIDLPSSRSPLNNMSTPEINFDKCLPFIPGFPEEQ